jgi:hypothetical protein
MVRIAASAVHAAPIPANFFAQDCLRASRIPVTPSLRGFSLLRRGTRGRGLVRIIHSRGRVFLQLAQPFFFLFLFLCEILLALFVLVIRLCQFIVLPAAGLVG